MSISQHLDCLIRARYPLIAIASYEEQRVLRNLLTIATAQGKELLTWSVTAGFQKVNDTGELVVSGDEAMSDVLTTLQSLPARQDNAGKCIYVLRDIHPFLSDPLTQRALRDLARQLIVGRKTVILLSPDITIPSDLQKEIALIDYPLPDVDELRMLLIEAGNGITQAGGSVHLNGDTEPIVNALRGLSEDEVKRVLRQAAIVNGGELSASAIPTILKEKQQLIRKSGILEYYEPDVTVNDVGGLDNLKSYVSQRQNAFSQQAREYGLDLPRGVLMVGLPGTGKSLMAKVMTGGKLPLLRLDFGALMGGIVGESERNLRHVFRLAGALAPCVLWIDEIEKALGGQGDLDGGTSKRMLGSLLTWMQEQRDGVYVVATANDVRSLRPELLRRFDDLFFVGLPDEQDRADILRIHLAKRRRDPDAFDIAGIAAQAVGYTGAELEKVVIKAMYGAWGDQRDVTTADLLTAIPQVVPIARTMEQDIAELTEWARGRALPASTPRQKYQAQHSSIEL